jgi:hypothetical protein
VLDRGPYQAGEDGIAGEAAMTKRTFDKLDPELLKAMEQERRHALAWEPYRENGCARSSQT